MGCVEVAFEIGGVPLAVFGMVKQGVDVVKDCFFGYSVVGVVLPEPVSKMVLRVG